MTSIVVCVKHSRIVAVIFASILHVSRALAWQRYLLKVDRGRGLVHYQDARVLEERAREAEELSLAVREI